MNIHEYHAKSILRHFGIPVPEGHVIYNGNSARDWAKHLGKKMLAESGLNIVSADGTADAAEKIVKAVNN